MTTKTISASKKNSSTLRIDGNSVVYYRNRLNRIKKLLELSGLMFPETEERVESLRRYFLEPHESGLEADDTTDLHYSANSVKSLARNLSYLFDIFIHSSTDDSNAKMAAKEGLDIVTLMLRDLLIKSTKQNLAIDLENSLTSEIIRQINSFGDISDLSGKDTVSSLLNDDTEISRILDTVTKQVSASVEKANEKLEDNANRIKLQFDEEFNKQLTSTKKNISQHEQMFEKSHAELNDLLVVAGAKTHSVGYTAQADKEKSIADNLRYVGSLWLAVLSIFAAYDFHSILQDISSEKFDFGIAIMRWLVVFLMTLPSIYLLRESSRHRSDERRYRELGVQMATINSYLDGFTDEDKVKIKHELTSNFFSTKEAKVDDSSVPDLLKSFEKSLDAVIHLAKKK
ncbi:hypothetical protein [Vibrio coralliilyticus]|uniref:hypothetical protein n=2 Tax=Vibrio coralliilyticus TaxID=190893 RepID=UPI001560449E|nr:hypothetical protein [Vibrio coralliilyticus]NRF28942.1 hypothetical protein [Vibrio coralliilyticus]NRF50807.1 hypothetical protein [Vibrio coralliilyticus]